MNKNEVIDYDYIYSQIIEKLEKEIDEKIEKKITEILYSPILEDKQWPKKKRI